MDMTVSNKKIPPPPRVVTFEMGKKLANEWNITFVESSAKQIEVCQTHARGIM